MPSLKQLSEIILLAAAALLAAPFFTMIIFKPAPEHFLSIARGLATGGLLLWIAGCCLYARSIGRHFLWGLLGVSVVGFLVLLFLPEHKPSCMKEH